MRSVTATDAVTVDQANRSLGHEVFEACGAIFIRNHRLPQIHDANHVARVRAASPDALDALLAHVDGAVAHCRHRQVVIDPDTPPEVEARLAIEGYDDVEGTVIMVLEADIAGPLPPPHVIRPVVTADDWDAYERLRRLDWAERARRLGLGDLPAVADGLVAIARAKVPPVRHWIAHLDGAARGYISSWEGPHRIGQVEDLYVEPTHRHRGLATALIRHGVTDARRAGADAVVIVADVIDTPKAMYAAMGFRPVYVLRKYTRYPTSP